MQVRGAAAALLLFGLIGALQTSTPATPNQPKRLRCPLTTRPPTFSAKVNLVMVPVVVRDGKGKAIGTLKKEDFQLFDKGKLQAISRFSVEKAGEVLIPAEVGADEAAVDKSAAPAHRPRRSRNVSSSTFLTMFIPRMRI